MMKLPLLLSGVLMSFALLATMPVMAQDAASPYPAQNGSMLSGPTSPPPPGVEVIDDLSTGSEYIGGNPTELYPMPRLHIGVQLDAIRTAMLAMSNATPKPNGD